MLLSAAGPARAMETADVVLMGDDLTQLPFILGLSRKTKGTITANIVFALAAAGAATLWMAVAADVGALVAVTPYGMHLRRLGS